MSDNRQDGDQPRKQPQSQPDQPPKQVTPATPIVPSNITPENVREESEPEVAPEYIPETPQKPVDKLKPESDPGGFDKQKFGEADVGSLDTFGEHKIDFSGELDGKEDEEVLDFILGKEDSEIVPWESVTLPSGGVYYDGMIPDGVVQVRPMSIYTEKILATMRLAKSGQALDLIFKYCVRFPNEQFDPVNLLVGDSTFLLFYLRGITFGNLYDFTVKCSDEDCAAVQSHTFDLNQLASTIKGPIGEVDEEPYEVRLPYLSEATGRDFIVKVRMLRRYDLTTMTSEKKHKRLVGPSNARVNKLTKRFRQVQSVESLNDVVEKNLSLVIVEVMGTRDRFKIEKLVERMHSSDTAAIRQYLDENSPGVDTTIVVNCNECNNEMRISLPITESFFRRTV